MRNSITHQLYSNPDRARTSLALVAIYFLLTGWNISLLPIKGPDEPRYASAARTMVRDGNLLVPYFNTRPRLVKPILFYWLLSGAAWIGAKIGLDIVTAMRIVPLSMGALVVMGTHRLGIRLLGPHRGLIAAGVVMTTFEFQRLARELVVDMTLTAFLIWAWVFFVEASERIEQRTTKNVTLLCFYLMLGMACLTKGPFMVGLFVVLPIITYLIVTRQTKALLQAGLWWGMPLALAIGNSWFVAIYLSGHDSLAFFIRENLQRMVGQADHQHFVPFVFYLEVIWENLAPWSLLIPFVTMITYRYARIIRPLSNNALLLASATTVPFTLLGLAVSKRGLYLLPLYPFFALLVSLAVERILSRKTIISFKLAFSLIVIGAIICGTLDVFMTFKRASEPGIEVFYQHLRTFSADKLLVMFGESANEAVWYLDRNVPVDRLSRNELQERFFDRNDTLLLVSEKELAREPDLSSAINVLATLKRGTRTYSIARPEIIRRPSQSLFEVPKVMPVVK